MSEYTQGICQDGAAILRDGQPMTIEEILAALRSGDQQSAEIERLRADRDSQQRLCIDAMLEVDELKQERDQLKEEVLRLGSVIVDHDHERDRLKAAVEALRMQLMVVNDIAGEAIDTKSYDWNVRATNAVNSTYSLLKKTPEHSLAAHDAEVAENAIKALRDWTRPLNTADGVHQVHYLNGAAREKIDMYLGQLRASAEEVKS
ncbi:hypothetical protein [Marinobacterium lutimaris]|uniref:Ead/Ea22-like family protein n=1 Tax=Marinobacterium lutimaris TaxID=568106 RepID=A0A1H5XQE2_9GAMM|nr:hypothetical protein [Marinobacterium lutimaris]SEG13892.1 hypothetical protein SAMN05444390_1011464 [Marinobacterium lutimaris]